jgi:hypothetical protein
MISNRNCNALKEKKGKGKLKQRASGWLYPQKYVESLNLWARKG